MSEQGDPEQHGPELPPTGAQPVGGEPTQPPDASTGGTPTPKGYFYARGMEVGAYTLRTPLGKGGFGEVWRAERRNPNMTAAVKLIRPDRADADSLARFSAECQALALLDHPGIARIHDAGVTADGSPYLAMEYIHGVPLAEFCDREKLPIDARLALLADIADAVHHAHTQGIIHRDLKPDNILVSIHEGGDPSARIVDFGIAKAVNKNVRLTDMTITHDLNTMIGTPSYMSPEQLESTQAGVDTRTDIFALGVICYELLAGVLPLSERDDATGLEGMLRLIRAERPEPVVRYSQLPKSDREAAAYRRGELTPEQLEKVLRTRVRHIPMKAMRPERNKRFSSAAAMAQDIRHHLADEDFAEAAAESRVDRLARSVRRNKAGYSAAAAVLVLLVGGIVSTSIGLRMAREAEAEAVEEANRANLAEQRSAQEAERARLAEAQASQRADELMQVAEFQRSLLAGIEPALMGSRLREDFALELEESWRRAGLDETERQRLRSSFEELSERINPTNLAIQALDRNIFDQTLNAIDDRFASQPVLRAQLLSSTALTMRQVGLLDRAFVAQSRAVKVYEDTLGPNDTMTIEARILLARIVSDTGDAPRAEQLLTEVIESCGTDQEFLELELLARAARADVLVELGRPDEAEREAVAVLERRTETLGPDDPQTLQSLGSVGFILVAQGRLREAEPYYRDAFEARARVLGADHPDTVTAENNLAYLLQQLGDTAGAEPLMRSVLERRRSTLGDEHPSTLTAKTNLAGLLRATGRAAEATPLYEQALKGRRRVLGADHPETIAALNNMGVLLHRSLGRAEMAEPYLREAYEQRRRFLGEEHPQTLTSQVNLGVLLMETQRLEEAAQFLSSAAEIYRRTLGDTHPNTLAAMLNLAGAQRAAGDLSGAERTLRQSLDSARASLGRIHPTTLRSVHDLADILARQRQFEEAERLFDEAYQGRIEAHGPGDPQTLASLKALGDVRIARGNLIGAEEAYAQLLSEHLREDSATRSDAVGASSALALVLQRLDRHADAAVVLEQGLLVCEEFLGPEHPNSVTMRNNLGNALVSAGMYPEAADVLERGQEAARSLWSNDPAGRLGSYLARFGTALAGAGRLAESERVLLEAHAVFEAAAGIEDPRSKQVAAQLAEIYEAMHRVDPERGYAEKAVIWRSQSR